MFCVTGMSEVDLPTVLTTRKRLLTQYSRTKRTDQRRRRRVCALLIGSKVISMTFESRESDASLPLDMFFCLGRTAAHRVCLGRQGSRTKMNF